MLPESVAAKLLEVRNTPGLQLKPNEYLRNTFKGLDGKERPLIIRDYQAQMIVSLAMMNRFIVGDDCGLGKTLEVIASLTYLWAKNPDTKVVVLTTKSAIQQWADEVHKFTQGVNAYPCTGTPKQREKARESFLRDSNPSVLIMGYRTAVQDFTAIQKWKGFVFIADECTNFKNPKAQVSQVCRHLSQMSIRTWGLTATLIKNHLMEGFGIYQVVYPEVFQHAGKNMSLDQFMHYYCILEMMSIPRSNRKIPKVVGYLPEKVAEFRKAIQYYYLGRPKHEVSHELPLLTTKNVTFPLSAAQDEKYKDALKGLLEVGENEVEVSKLTALIYCQQIVNHLELIQGEGDSPKLESLIDLLTEGELEGEKVIVFSRFAKMVDIIMSRLKEEKIGAVRVTGAEDSKDREAAKKAFQDLNSDTKVVCITMAGSDAINLQAAKAVVFFDTPWSAGDYLQILGRMIRIGSSHQNVYALHLISELPNGKSTIDGRVMEVLQKKMGLIEAALGSRVKTDVITATNDVNDLFAEMTKGSRFEEDAGIKDLL